MWLTLALGLLACTDDGPTGDTATSDTSPPPSCDEGQIVDGERCVSARCGVRTWGEVAVDGDAVWALGGSDGDGSQEAPLGDLKQALDLAVEQGVTTVVLGEGSYTAGLRLGISHAGLSLVGRCPELTELVDSVTDGEFVLESGTWGESDTFSLTGLTVLVYDATSTVIWTGGVLSGTRHTGSTTVLHGLWVYAGHADLTGLRDSVIQDSVSSSQFAAACLVADRGGAVLVEDSLVQRCAGIAVMSQSDDPDRVSHLELERTELSASSGDTHQAGRGLAVALNATAGLEDVVISDMIEAGLLSIYAPAAVEIDGLTVRARARPRAPRSPRRSRRTAAGGSPARAWSSRTAWRWACWSSTTAPRSCSTT